MASYDPKIKFSQFTIKNITAQEGKKGRYWIIETTNDKLYSKYEERIEIGKTYGIEYTEYTPPYKWIKKILGETLPQEPDEPAEDKNPDWDAIAEGKVRHGLVCSMIEAGWEKDKIIDQLSEFTELVMTGKVEAGFDMNEITKEVG